MKFYVGNLNFRITEDQLRALFEPYGPVEDIIILTDRETGRSRGFGFITLGDDEKAKQAYADLNQQDFEGRTLVMNEARPRTDGPTQGGGHSEGWGQSGGYKTQRPGGKSSYVSRSVGGGYSNQTYGTRAPAPESRTSTPDSTDAPDDSADADVDTGGGGYSRGGND